MNKSLYRNLLVVAVFLFAGLIVAGCGANDPIVEALGKEPKQLPQACPANYGEFDWFGNITLKSVSITHIVGSPSMGAKLKFTQSGEELWFYPKSYEALDCSKAGFFYGACIENWPVVEQCILGQLDPLGTLIPTDTPNDSSVPYIEGPKPPSQSADSQGTNQPGISVPQVFDFFWQKPNGEMVPFGSEEEARAAAQNSWEGGSVVMQTKLGDLTLGPPVILGNPIEPFSPPSGVTLLSPNEAYYGTGSGMFFSTLEEALYYAKGINESTDIHTYVRNVDYGTVQSVDSFTPISAKNTLNQFVDIGASQNYIQVTATIPSGGSQFAYFTEDNLEGAKIWAYQVPYGSDISLYKRGELLQSLLFVNAWVPPAELVTAFGGTFSDLSHQYWVYQTSTSSVPVYFKDSESAVKFAEDYGDVCIFPGGLVIPYIRDILQDGTEIVSPWECPEGLPKTHKAGDPYSSRISQDETEKFYPSEKEAIMSSWESWYLGLSEEKIYSWKRGVKSSEDPLTNWWVPWQWVVFGIWVVTGIVQFFRKPVAPELLSAVSDSRKTLQKAYFGISKALRWGIWLVVLLFALMYVANHYGNLVAAGGLVVISLVVSLFYISVGFAYRRRNSGKSTISLKK